MFEEFAHFFQEAYPSELKKAADTRNDMIKTGEMATMKKIARDFIRPNGGVSLPSLNYERYKKYPDRHDENWRYCKKYPEKDYNMTYKYVEQQLKKFTDDKIYSIQQLRSAKKNLFDLFGVGHPDEKVLITYPPISLAITFKIINIRQHKLFKPSSNTRFIHFSPQSSITSLSPTICSRDFGSVKHTYVYPTSRCYFWAIDMDKVPEPAISYAYSTYGDNVYEYIPKSSDRIIVDESENKRYPGMTPVFIETDSSLTVKPVSGEIRYMKRAFEKGDIKWRDPYPDMKTEEKLTTPNQKVNRKCDMLEIDFKSKQSQYSRMKETANGKIDKLKTLFGMIKSYIEDIPTMVDSSKAEVKERYPEATNLGDFDKLGKKYLRKAKEMLKEIAALLKRQGVVVEYAFDDDDTSGTSDFDTHIDNDPDDCYCEAEGMNKYYLADVSLREADPLDIPLIVKMKVQTILDSEPDHEPTQEELAKITRYVENEIPKHLNDTKKIMYDNDRFIGILISYQKGADWFIDDIYLLPECRYQGIGRMILADEVAGHDQIALRVYKNNTHAIELYESLGFKVEGDMGATQLMRLRKNPADLVEGYRVTYNGIGIYQALKKVLFDRYNSSGPWTEFVNSPACSWLPKPPTYGDDDRSFFTKEGYDKFMELTLPVINKYIDQTKIYIEMEMIPKESIKYSDEYQFITSSDFVQESKWEVDPDDCYCESSVVFDKGMQVKVDVSELPFDTVYHGSIKNISMFDDKRTVFVTPSIAMASIFAGRPDIYKLREIKQRYRVKSPDINLHYLEWSDPKTLVMKQPLKTVHVIMQGAPEITDHYKYRQAGYIYAFNIKDPAIRDHVYKSTAMGPNEYVIKGISPTPIEKIPIEIDVDVTGAELPERFKQEETLPTSGDFAQYAQYADLDTARGPIMNIQTVQEAKLPAKKRNKLDDSDFALVYVDAYGDKIRKYPINDEAHVRAAARMFPRGVPLKYRSEVAGKILHRAHKFGIDTSGWNSVNAAHKK